MWVFLTGYNFLPNKLPQSTTYHYWPSFQTIWVIWTCITNFLVPTLLILLIWVIMAHHFIVHPANFNSRLAITTSQHLEITNLSKSSCYRILKRATIKMVFITGLFLVTVSPFCFVFASAAFNIPETTKWLDWTFFFPLLNATIQPIVYILSFKNLRNVFIKVISCERSKREGGTTMVLTIFKTARSLWQETLWAIKT